MSLSLKHVWLLGLVFVTSLEAVQLNPNGSGEVLIFPYYTVNNDLNTLFSVVNTTAEAKAIKVRFLEGDIGREVLVYNVYLNPHDVWVGALLAVESTIAGHEGEPSALHLSVDASCAPYIHPLDLGQEFLPFMIELDGTINDDMSRVREGHVEVLEMGVIEEPELLAAMSRDQGIPIDCEVFAAEWEDGEWDRDVLSPPTGGLIGSASIINVGEGLALSYDAVALTQFWQGPGLHSGPGELLPDLASAHPESTHLSSEDELIVSQWPSGFEAVSAVLMQSQIFNEYAIYPFLLAKTEWVVSFPTKKFHTAQNLTVIPPFSESWDGLQSCDAVDLAI